MEKTAKKTKAMYFAELREMVINTVTDEEKQDELLEFIDKQLEAIDKRKAYSAKRAETKKTESDELTAAIYSHLTYELMTVEDILATFEEDKKVTRNKITARLSKLIAAEEVVKEQIKTEDGKKRMAYKLAE